MFACIFLSCRDTGEGVLFDQEGTKLALCVGAKSFGAGGGERGEGHGVKRAGDRSSRHIGEGNARVDGPWCEELCDTCLKRLRCGHWTLAKEKTL